MANICRNSAIDKTRSKEYTNKSKTNTIEDYVYRVESESETLDAVYGIGVKELFQGLSEEHRFVIEYIYFKGFTHSEVSEEFDISLGTVKSRIRSAINLLKKNLNKI